MIHKHGNLCPCPDRLGQKGLGCFASHSRFVAIDGAIVLLSFSEVESANGEPILLFIIHSSYSDSLSGALTAQPMKIGRYPGFPPNRVA